MKDNFDAALKTILVFEGGKVDDPRDPGGRTNEGVTQRVYSAWRVNNRLGAADVYAMTADERDAIYRLQYADKVKFDALPAGVDLVMLDGAVNSGPRQAVLWCQRALGFTGKDVDGSLGEATFAAIQAADPAVLVNGICDRRMAFLHALKTWGRFGRGWTIRVEGVRKSALVAATGGAITIRVPGTDSHVKATIADAKRIPIGSPGAGTAGIGAAVTASTATLQAVKAQLDPLTAFLPHTAQAITYVEHAQVLLGSFGGLLAIAGGLWFAWNRDRAARLRDALDIPAPR